MALPRAFRPAVARFSRTRFFRAVGPRVMPPLEKMMKVVTRGRVPLSGLLVPSLVLHTVGARTGLPRDTTLMYCPEPPGRMLIVGSNFAGPNHPAWTSNLLADPAAAVTVRGRRIEVRAQLVGDDEREEVWAKLEANWPGYRGYERSSGRVLRIFRLTPTRIGRRG